MGDTKTTLVQDIKKRLNTLPPIKKIMAESLIKDAQLGIYHDFESPMSAPKMALAIELTLCGLPDLADNVRKGLYDDESPSPEEEERLKNLLK